MKTKSFFPRLKKQLAFTMIELLIVIAILGILAVAVLSALNPIEQINRGRDTASRSDAEQLLTAIDRYYAMQGYFPWQANPNDVIAINGGVAGEFVHIDTTLTRGTGLTCPILYLLSDTAAGGANCTSAVGSQELKISYIDKISATNYNELYVYHAADDYASTYVCFAPQSNSFRVEALTRLDANADGTIATTELPADYPPNAVGNTVNCGSEGNCVCLP